jgi:hypothetical protein
MYVLSDNGWRGKKPVDDWLTGNIGLALVKLNHHLLSQK